MANPPSTSDDVEELKEEITFNETLYESLAFETDPVSLAEKQNIADNIRSLKAQLDKMQNSHAFPDWGSSGYGAGDPHSHTNSQQHNSPGSAYSNHSFLTANQYLMPPPNSMTLPSRKRYADFDDDDLLSVPKSRKATPIGRPDSRDGSIDSFASDFSDDPILRDLLGGDIREEARNNKAYLRDLEVRRLQEEEDARFARELQERWNKDNTRITPQHAMPSSSATQSYLRPDGSWQKPSQPTQSKHQLIKSEPRMPEQRLPESRLPGSLTPLTDDSSDFEEISSTEWTTSFGPSQSTGSYNQYNAPTFTSTPMSGAFNNNFNNPYSSNPGTSVYGNNIIDNSLGSRATTMHAGLGSRWNQSHLLSPQANFHSMPGAFPGSFSMPLDLDAYPTPSYSPNPYSIADPEQTQEEIRDLLKHIRPDDDLTEEQLREVQPEGLKIDLMRHQRKGFAWMKSMEEGTNKGGILADDMGLGKTIQALSLILAKRPPQGSRKPTLVVAPVALMQQWKREIEKFVDRSQRLEVLILHAEMRNKPWKYIREYDVVLTTYGTLSSELKRKDAWNRHVELVPEARPTPQQQLPILGEKCHFHRIILDEAQCIKNKNTRAAHAACQIRADYRWCLSGTPMQNNVDEIHSLIKFCRIKPYHDSEKFATDIGRPLKRTTQWGKEKAMERLQALLRAVLLRRTKKSEIDGQPIIQLPEKHTIEERAIFTQDELDFYKALETQSQIQFNRFLKKGSIGRHYSHALVLLLRLRQCCCSAQLITNAPDFMSSNAMEDVDYIENARTLPSDVIRRLDEADAFECPICMDAVENPLIFNPCGHSLCQECLASMTEKAMEDSGSKLSCPHCRADVNIHKVTTHESYLRVHHPDRAGVEPLKEEEEDEDSDSDSEDEADDDSDDGADLKDFIVPDDEIETESGASDGDEEKLEIKHFKPEVDGVKGKSKSKPKLKKTKDVKGKGKPKKKLTTLADLRREGLKNKSAKKKYLRKLAKGWQSSAKIDRTVSLLREIRDRGEGEKTIVFSNFTSFLDLVEVPLSTDDELDNYVRYDGSMKPRDRTESVMKFTDDPRCTIMLVSLKAGNAGLNLTAANHVILLDPFWNPFVEYQAADRCYRIGQTREVTIHRILIGDQTDNGDAPDPEKDFTVEDRILKLQEKKRLLVETALDEGAAKNLGRLSTRDLGYLFGVNSME